MSQSLAISLEAESRPGITVARTDAAPAAIRASAVAPVSAARSAVLAPESVAAEQQAAELRARAQALVPALAAQAAEHDLTGAPPQAQFEALFDADLLRLTIARRDGGHGAGLSLAREIVQIVASGDPSVALILAMHYSNHAAIARARQLPAGTGPWPEALAQRLTAHALREPALLNAIQVEPALGSPSHGGLPATTARWVDGQWRLSGHKLYATGSHLLSWLLVLAVTDEPQPRLGSFVVPRDAPGVQIVETWNPLGMRATASHDIVFEDVAVPAEDVVGLAPASAGLQRDEAGQSWYFNLIGTIYTAAAQSAQDWLLGFLNTRRPSALAGGSLAELPTVQDTVGRIQFWLETSRTLLAHHAQVHEAGGPAGALAAAAKYVAVENATQATALALQLAGNHGISRDNPLERHYRNAQCAQIHAPPNPLLRANAGRQALRAAAA